MAIGRYSNEEEEQSLLGPEFDVVVTMTAVLLVLFSVVITQARSELADFLCALGLGEEVRERFGLESCPPVEPRLLNAKMSFLHHLTEQFNGILIRVDRSADQYRIANESGGVVRVSNDLGAVQRFFLEENILFEKGKFELEPGGIAFLKGFSAVLHERMDQIEEVQIHGHASSEHRICEIDRRNFEALRFRTASDTHGLSLAERLCVERREHDPTLFNLNLASDRALAVFKYLIERSRVNPYKLKMSFTSYGEFMPVQRDRSQGEYTRQDLENHNATDALQKKNRRIEVLLFYRLTPADGSEPRDIKSGGPLNPADQP